MDGGRARVYVQKTCPTCYQQEGVVNRLNGVALVVLLAAGCARAPELANDGAAPQAEAELAAAVTPDLVIDVNELAARTPPPILCRDMLRPGSNVIVKTCGTTADWKRFERRQEKAAEETVRTFQRGRY
jgi:hypothetical protein